MGEDFSTSTIIRIGWDALHRDTLALAYLVKRRGPYKGIIAVARGGLIPAAIIAQTLDLRVVDTVCVVSYDDRIRRDGDPLILKPVEGDGSGWLVIDDLVDSGRTLRRLRLMLPKAHYATIYAKPHGRPVVDTALVAVDQHVWLVFPWDEEPGE